jgi:hypothetical protein
MVTSSKRQILESQRDWAVRRGATVDENGYVQTPEANLFAPLSSEATIAFERGGGGEMKPNRKRLPKMCALHSSSALVVNVFDYWIDHETSVLGAALGLDQEIASLRFEAQFSTGLPGTPPTLDLSLELENEHVFAIESKFAEWFTPKSAKKDPFKQKYFPDDRELWTDRRLPKCQELARALQAREQRFQRLDAPQLLKHALGLATQRSSKWELLYLYFDWPGHEGTEHRSEILRFGDAVGPEVAFRSLSYQSMFARLLTHSDASDLIYLEWLSDRYFRAPVE